MKVDPSVVAQLKDFQAWSSSGAVRGPISLLDYVGFIATLDSLLAFASLFLPELISHDGHYFLASGFSVDLYEAWERGGQSPREIQRVLNHLHISSLLQQQTISHEAALEAARVVVAVWSLTLGPQGLVVEAMGSTLEDTAVTFYSRVE